MMNTSVQVDNYDSDEDDRLIGPAPSFFFVAIANPRIEPFSQSRDGIRAGIESRKSQLVAGKRILFLGIPGLRICLGSDHHLACCNEWSC